MNQTNLHLKNIIFFGPITLTTFVKSIGNKLVFVQKQNKKNEVIRYKTQFGTQWFAQRPCIDCMGSCLDCMGTYSPIMDVNYFKILYKSQNA